MVMRRTLSIGLIALFVFSNIAFAQPIPVVTPVACVAPGMNARVAAQIPATLTTTYRPRVFFKANGQTDEYYVEMQRGANGWWAMLPQIANGTTSVTYRVGATDASNHWVTSAPLAVNTSASCAPVSLSRLEQRSAKNIVLGMTNSTQPTLPTGFSCIGVVSVITAAGQMRPATECRNALIAAGLPVGAAAGAGTMALSAGTIAALSAGAVAAGLVIANNTKGHHKVSPSNP